MLLRTLPLALLLSACSGAAPALAPGSPEAVWAELIALAAAPTPDLGAIADRITLHDGSGGAADAAEAGVALTQLQFHFGDLLADGQIGYTVVSREVTPIAGGRRVELGVRLHDLPGREARAVMVETDGRARLDAVYWAGDGAGD